jgi:hypothetical protein
MVDIGNVIGFSFSWYKNREFLKYAFLYWGLLLAFLIAGSLVLFALFGGYVNAFTSNSDSLLPLIVAEVMSGALIVKILVFFALAFVLFIAGWFAALCIDILLVLFALRSSGISHLQFSFTKVFEIIGFGVVAMLLALFYSLDNELRKWQWLCLAGMVVSIVFFAMYGISLVFLLLGLLLFFVCSLVYFYFVLVNCLRMSVGRVIFLQNEKGIAASLKESFGLTKGHLIEIFICNLAVPLLVAVASAVFLGIIGTILGLALSPFLPSIPLPVAPTAEKMAFAGFQPASTSFSTSLFAGNMIASFLFIPFSLLVTAFMAVGIYAELLKDKSAPAAGAAAPPKPK